MKFYYGSTLISTDTSSPYSASISNPANGTYVLTAVAKDDDGATTTSTSVTVTVGTVTTNKQIIGYITQWDAWKTTTAGVPSQGAYTHLNVDMSKYTILNFSFLVLPMMVHYTVVISETKTSTRMG
ncbi:MAG: hypothetical protein HC831_10870 [Chloroflexia bacterium]|nr:hypothetical protein [Chloroflexia bacterium]